MQNETQLDQIEFLTAAELKEANASIEMDWEREVSFGWSAVAHLSDLLIFDTERCSLEIDGDRHEVRVIWR